MFIEVGLDLSGKEYRVLNKDYECFSLPELTFLKKYAVEKGLKSFNEGVIGEYKKVNWDDLLEVVGAYPNYEKYFNVDHYLIQNRDGKFRQYYVAINEDIANVLIKLKNYFLSIREVHLLNDLLSILPPLKNVSRIYFCPKKESNWIYLRYANEVEINLSALSVRLVKEDR